MLSPLRFWIPALLWAALIFALSSRSTVPTPGVWGGDKLMHFGAFAVLGWLLAYAANRSALAPVWPVFLGLLYAASDEWHQSFVSGRSVEGADWIADALGVGAGVWGYRWWVRRAA
jgi:VanZ family protein